MNELKEYLANLVGQTEYRMGDRMDEMESRLRLEIKDSERHILGEMQDGFEGVADAIAGINDHSAEQDKRHKNEDKRLTKLEHRVFGSGTGN